MPFGIEVTGRDAAEWGAWATLALVLVTAVYVWITRQSVAELRAGTEKTVWELRASTEKQIGELRATRFAEFTPMLRWQSPDAGIDTFNGGAGGWDMQLNVLLSNEGPGAARIYDYRLEVGLQREESLVPEQFEVIGVGRPSTMPKAGSPGDRIDFQIRSGRRGTFEAGTRVFTIRLLYGDLLGEFEYDFYVAAEPGHPSEVMR
jgi:hypothetical protein